MKTMAGSGRRVVSSVGATALVVCLAACGGETVTVGADHARGGAEPTISTGGTAWTSAGGSVAGGSQAVGSGGDGLGGGAQGGTAGSAASSSGGAGGNADVGTGGTADLGTGGFADSGSGGTADLGTGGSAVSSSGGSAGLGSGGSGGIPGPDLSGAYDLTWGEVLITPNSMIEPAKFGFSRGKTRRLELRQQGGGYQATVVDPAAADWAGHPILNAPAVLATNSFDIDLSSQALSIIEDRVENGEKSRWEQWKRLTLDLDAGGNLAGSFSASGTAFRVTTWTTDISMLDGTLVRDRQPPTLAWKTNPNLSPPYASSYAIEFGSDGVDPGAMTAAISATLTGPHVPDGTAPSITPTSFANWPRIPGARIDVGLGWAELLGAKLRVAAASGLDDMNGNIAPAQELLVDFPDLAPLSEVRFDQGLAELATWGNVRLLGGAACESPSCLGIAPCETADHGIAGVVRPGSGSTLVVRHRYPGGGGFVGYFAVMVTTSGGTYASNYVGPNASVDWGDLTVALPGGSDKYLVSLRVSGAYSSSASAPNCGAAVDVAVIDRVTVR
jgi:hypothetical protein